MLFTLYPDLDNIGRSANPRINHNGIRGTIRHAGPTFHACIEINEMGLMVLHFKYGMGTDFSAQAAANAFFLVQNET